MPRLFRSNFERAVSEDFHHVMDIGRIETGNIHIHPYPICSMVHVYLPTKLGDFVSANVGKYSIHGASVGTIVPNIWTKQICSKPIRYAICVATAIFISGMS